MRKYLFVVLSLLIIFALSSCKNNPDDEHTTDLVDASSENTSEDSSAIFLPEAYSSELKEPDFDFPRTYADVEAYINLPETDNTENDGFTENFYSDGTLLYSKTYNDNSDISGIAIYENDQTTVAVLYEFLYEDTGETAIDIDFNENGETVSRRKLIYHDNGVIKSVYNMTSDAESGAPIVDSYEYDKNGNLVQCINSDSFNQIILEAIISGLQE